MQRLLTDIRRQPSPLAARVLEEAKRRGIATIAHLAKEIHVDMDSVEAVLLKGGRPNTRTIERYRAFLKVKARNVHELIETVMPAPLMQTRETGGSPKSETRRPGTISPPEPQDSLSLHAHMTAILKRQEVIAESFARAMELMAEEMRASIQQMRILERALNDLEKEPAMVEFLSAGKEVRKLVKGVLRHMAAMPTTGATGAAAARTPTRSRRPTRARTAT